MNCPKDGNHLNQLKLNDLQISVCEKCRGVWLDEGELYLLVSCFSSQKLDAKLDLWKEVHTTGKTAPRDFWREGTLACPNDTSPLQKHYFAGNSGVGIDNCPKCNGFWIDGDEIEALLEYNKLKPTDIAVDVLFRDETKFQKELAELATLPYAIQSMFANPMYVGYLIVNHIVKLIVEELGEERNSSAI